MLVTGCGAVASSPGSSISAGIAVSAGAGCAADHRQNLVFAGALAGRLTCDAGQAICDFAYAGKKTDKAFTGAIHSSAAGKPLLISFAVAPFDGPGTYKSDNHEGGTSITVDGPAHWVGHVGDPIVVTTSTGQTLT